MLSLTPGEVVLVGVGDLAAAAKLALANDRPVSDYVGIAIRLCPCGCLRWEVATLGDDMIVRFYEDHQIFPGPGGFDIDQLAPGLQQIADDRWRVSV